MLNESISNSRSQFFSATLVITIVSIVSIRSIEAQNQRFQFGVMGDTSYSKIAEQEFDRLMAAVNKESLAFVVHVGDFEADPRTYERNPDKTTMPCTDDNFRRTLAIFERSENPLILTPGDNDWTDCHEVKTRKFDPVERLSKLRDLFFPERKSLGQKTISVETQATDTEFKNYRENLLWSHASVTFATLHIVGSNNNKGRTPEMDAEHAARTKANIAWMQKVFADAKAKNSAGLVLFAQANPGFENHWTPGLLARQLRNLGGARAPEKPQPSGYDEILVALAMEMENYKKPTLFVHGDTHTFHVNKPLLSQKTKRFFENFTRVETFGDPDTHWVRITVDHSKPELFIIEPEIIAENRAN